MSDLMPAIIEVEQEETTVVLELEQPEVIVDIVDDRSSVKTIDIVPLEVEPQGQLTEGPIVEIEFDGKFVYLEIEPLKYEVDIVTEQLVQFIDVTVDGLLPGPPGPTGPPGASAVGSVPTPTLIWVMDHGLAFYPAGVKCFDLDGEEIEPEELTYVSANLVLAAWPEAIAGSWMIS